MDRLRQFAIQESAPARDFAGDLKTFAGELGRAHVLSLAPLPSEELTVAIAMAGSGPRQTDDSAEVAAIVDQIDEHPHLFAERYLTLEREYAALKERVDGLCAREVL